MAFKCEICGKRGTNSFSHYSLLVNLSHKIDKSKNLWKPHTFQQVGGFIVVCYPLRAPLSFPQPADRCQVTWGLWKVLEAGRLRTITWQPHANMRKQQNLSRGLSKGWHPSSKGIYEYFLATEGSNNFLTFFWWIFNLFPLTNNDIKTLKGSRDSKPLKFIDSWHIHVFHKYNVLFWEVGRALGLGTRTDYQKRTGCNRLSL